MKSRRWIVVTIASVAILLIVGRIIAGWYVEYSWYDALGAGEVWKVKALDLILLRGFMFTVGTLFVFLNLYAVRRSFRTFVLPRRVGNIDLGEEVPGPYLVAGAIVLSVVISALLAFPHRDWISLDLVRYGDAFGETDPYFERDFAFWLYWLPLESSFHVWALITLLAVSLVVIFLYALTPSLRWENGQLHVSAYVRRHLFTLGAVLLFLLSWSYRLDAYGLLHTGSGTLGAFSAVDHHVTLPASLVLSLVAVAAGMLVLWSGWAGQVRLAFFAITAVLLIALTARQIVPPVAERFVTPNDVEAREKPYRETRDGYTRRAYDVDRLTREPPPAAPSVPDVARGASLWDGVTLSKAIARAHPSAKQNGALGWEVQDGRVVALAVLQPTGPESADSAPPWRIARVAGDVVDDRGGPVERIDPEDASGGALLPMLVHDSAGGYYIVADSAERVVGAELRTFRARLAHAWHLQDARFLRDTDGGAHVRAVLHRAVRERLHMLYPFFDQSDRLTPVMWRDSLYWTVHLYVTSQWYPLSRVMPLGGHPVRYLRHAGVAVVNAHTGRTVAIPDPSPDPVTSSWMRRFPSLFTEPSAFDHDFTRRIPPATDGMFVAALAFAQVGVRGQPSPPGHVPRLTGPDTVFAVPTTPPYYDNTSALLSTAVPILDQAERIRGLVTMEGGPEYRPQWRPLATIATRWTLMVDLLERPSDSVRTLFSDVRVVQGSVRVMPASNGFMGVQAHYRTRPDGTPQVLYGSVLRGDTVSMGSSVVSAVGMPVPAATEGPLTPEEFRARVETLYAAMRDALRRGDLNAFGNAYDALGKMLKRR